MNSAINFVVFFIATSCGPHPSQQPIVRDQPAVHEVSPNVDDLSNSFDVDTHKLESIGNIA